MKIAIVHDYLVQEGGAEKVLEVMHKIWPAAPIYTLFFHKKNMEKVFSEGNIRTSFLQKMPFALKRYQWYLPLMPVATESYDLSQYDVVISSSSAFAKSVITNPRTLHISYCHTPTRYLWSDTHRYVEDLRYPRMIKFFLPYLLNRLRAWDELTSRRPDKFIANSYFVSQRIKKYYRRESDIIYPPVETEKFFISSDIGRYYLTGGRLVPYKRFDITIHAFNQLGLPLKIFGEGPQLEHLKKIAKGNIEFLGKVGVKNLAELYSRCRAFIHPQVEDFGITAVEAMASGRPVIAYREGGAIETIVPGGTGDFFDEQSWEALADKVVRFRDGLCDPQKIKQHAEKFSVRRFQEELKIFVEKEYLAIKNFSTFSSPLAATRPRARAESGEDVRRTGEGGMDICG